MQDRQLDELIAVALQVAAPMTRQQKDAAWARLFAQVNRQSWHQPYEMQFQDEVPHSAWKNLRSWLADLLLVETMYHRAAENRESTAIAVTGFLNGQIFNPFYPFHPLQLRAY